MKVMLLAVLAAVQVAVPAPLGGREFRFERAVLVPAQGPAAACAALDAEVYAHAHASLEDVRLFSQGREVPYALTLSDTVPLAPGADQAEVLNLGMRGTAIVFDLRMPQRAYTAVDLDLRGQNFVGTARVTGSSQLDGGAQTDLGTYTVFDLTGQKLGRHTTLDLQESSFTFLHVVLRLSPAGAGVKGLFRAIPALVAGATVPPSREAQTVFTTVARTAVLVQEGSSTRAAFVVPAHVPVERVRIQLAPRDRSNFSRAVTITAHPTGAPAQEQEQISGEIAQLQKSEDGRDLRRQSLSVPATLGANARESASVVVSIENGDDRPLPIAAVILEMRERKLCFDVPAGPVTMAYGNPHLRAARYDFSRTFAPGAKVRTAQLGPEQSNPQWFADTPTRSFSERHPALLWIALLAAIGALGAVAFRSAPRSNGNHTGS